MVELDFATSVLDSIIELQMGKTNERNMGKVQR